MDTQALRELYSEEDNLDDWDYGESGTWKRMEEVPVGKPQLVPELGWFTKVAEDLTYDHDRYRNDVFMVLSFDTPSDTQQYYKITGWKDSYGSTYWYDNGDWVDRKTKTEVYYE